jgi:hypothetical protein
MTFDRLSLPIPEDLLEPSALQFAHRCNKKSRTETLDNDELGKLLEQFEYHSQMAQENARKIQEFLRRTEKPISKDPSIRKKEFILGQNGTISDNHAASSSRDLEMHIATINKAFSRKPRSLCRLSDDRFMASALDGTVSLWSSKSRNKLCQIGLGHGTFAECIATTPHHIYVCSVEKSSEECNDKFKILRLYPDLKMEREFADTRHTKLITCIHPYNDFVFCTGSDDHAIVLHNGSDPPTILSAHTSSVSSLCSIGTKLYSAGSDGRLNSIDLSSGRVIEKHKFPSVRFSHLLTDATNPTLLISSQQSCNNDQFQAIDSRCKLSDVVMRFGWGETANLSRYVKFGYNGTFVVAGTQSPLDKQSAVNIFDIRARGRSVLRETGFGERRWLESCFIRGDTLVANATDGSLSFINLVYM